jgi:hypothetical protein
MLLHLPIIVLATPSPVAVSDTVPKFDIVRECRFEGESTVEFDNRRQQDEAAALEQLTGEPTTKVDHVGTHQHYRTYRLFRLQVAQRACERFYSPVLDSAAVLLAFWRVAFLQEISP